MRIIVYLCVCVCVCVCVSVCVFVCVCVCVCYSVLEPLRTLWQLGNLNLKGNRLCDKAGYPEEVRSETQKTGLVTITT